LHCESIVLNQDFLKTEENRYQMILILCLMLQTFFVAKRIPFP
jgi:hypothetical protein